MSHDAAGAAYAEAVNDHFEKTVSEIIFPDDPDAALEFAKAMKESRDELRRRYNDGR